LVGGHIDVAYDLALRSGCHPDRGVEVLLAALDRALTARPGPSAAAADLLGGWLRHVRDLAGAASTPRRAGRLRDLLTGQGPGSKSTRPDLGVADPLSARLRDALAGVEDRCALALLLGDGYDLPPEAVAAALDLDLPEVGRRVAAGRLALLAGYHPATVGLLDHLPPCPAAIAFVAAPIEPTLPPAVGATLRRHAYHCRRCDEVAELQARARRIMLRLDVTRPSAAQRHKVAVAAAAPSATSAGSPTAPARLAADGRRRPSPILVAVAVSTSLAAGVAAGLHLAAAPPEGGHPPGAGVTWVAPATAPALPPAEAGRSTRRR